MAFCDVLSALMAERRVSERALARRVNVDRSFIHLLKTGQRGPGARTARLLDDELNAGGELVALAPREYPARRTILVAGALSGGLLAAADALLFGRAGDEGERLAWSAEHPSRVDMATVDSLADVLAAQRRAEDRAGALSVMAPVVAQLAVIEGMVRQARGPVRPALVNVGMQWAQFAAYLHKDAGDMAGEYALLAKALEWASELRDRTMTATVLAYRAEAALEAGELGTTVGLAQAVQDDPAVDAGQRADATELAARAYACGRDTAMAERKLGESAELAARIPAHEADHPSWLYWTSARYFGVRSGRTLGMLGRDPRYRAKAIETLQEGYDRLPAVQQGSAWAAVNLVHLAAVHARAGDADQAASVALRCANIARATESRRLAAMVITVHDRLRERWPAHPGVAALTEAIH